MKNNIPDSLLPFNLDLVFRHRLGRTLLLFFLGLAIIPMAVASVISYQTAYRQLEHDVRLNIRMATELRSRQLQAFFDGWTADTQRSDREPATDDFYDIVSQMLNTPIAIGSGYQSYLLDADRTLIAGTTGGPARHEKATVNTAQAQSWQDRQAEGKFDQPMPDPFAYAGPTGRPVIGTHTVIHLGDTPYALVLEIETAAAFGAINRLRLAVFTIVLLAFAGVLAVSAVMVRRIIEPVRDLSQRLWMAAPDQIDHGRKATVKDELGELVEAVDAMLRHTKRVEERFETQSRFIIDLTRLHRLIGGEQDLGELCLNALEFLSDTLDLRQAGFFILNDQGVLECTSRFPGRPDPEPQSAFDPDDKRAGQAAQDRAILVFHKDADNGQIMPVDASDHGNLITVPLVLRETVKGVLELEKTGRFNRFDHRFIEAAAEVIVVALNTVMIRRQEEALLEQTRDQARKLKVRETALEANTRELQAQTRAFQASEEKLQLKQLELEAANAQMVKNAADLEAHMAILEKQKQDMQKQNAELAKTHRELGKKARQLEISSRYKTEFMANMSHELRTPLNSILLLSRLLLENKEKTLTAKQFEFARTVHSAGEDLLNLINEILDLAKVESGKMEVEKTPVKIHAITNAMLVSFAPLAEQSGIKFRIHVDPHVPEQLFTDRKRLEQIVKNFLSNAFKFTARGTVSLEIAVSRESEIAAKAGNDGENNCLTISVVDTGIGIPESKQQMVFEAFQQVDGSTRRKYGGTGLGLSISRELARMLGGKISLESEDGRGSRFTLFLPVGTLPENEPEMIRRVGQRSKSPRTPAAQHAAEYAEDKSSAELVPDDRNRLAPGDKSLLIIDANAGSTEPIKEVAYQYSYKVLVAEQLPTGLHFADYYLPVVIFVNLRLPGGNGLRMIPRIKANPKSRHVPIFTVSPGQDAFQAAIHGAAGHVTEPIIAGGLETAFKRIEHLLSTQDRQVLIVASNPEYGLTIRDKLKGFKIHSLMATTAAEAKAVFKTNAVDAMIVHPEMSATEQKDLLTGLQNNPVALYRYSGTPLPSGAGPEAAHVNLKDIHTPDQLLLEMAAGLHLPPEALDATLRARLRAMDNQRNRFKGRKVLLVDDDMRTVFAVSNVLEDQGAKVITGKTGKESLDKLNGFPDIDLVLMDVMISGVDGYQAVSKIRSRDRYRDLPIIALTAKAMRGDRAKCIQAGADDYLAKPVNLDKLTSMLNIWLEPRRSTSDSIGA